MKQDRNLLLRVLGFALAMLAAASGLAVSAYAQVFSDLETALVDYSKADLEPAKTCSSLSAFKSGEIVQIEAEAVAAGDMVPAFCRVSGLLEMVIADDVLAHPRL